MSRVCEICGKHVVAGGSISRRGMAKKYGGVGSRVIAHNKRVFRPNLKKVRAWVNGGVKRITVCTSCIQAGKVVKPPKRNYQKSE
jgi:large subunit ribosomal protein L28